MTNSMIKRFVVNIGGRNKTHYNEVVPIAEKVARAVATAKPNLHHSIEVFGKNGGLTGSMQAFGDAYAAENIPWVPVLTPELEHPTYAPPISVNNPLLVVKNNNTERLAEIIKSPDNRLLIVTTGGSGTLEELSSALCENEFRIKWRAEAEGKPFPIFIVGDAAVAQWRTILHEVFKQLRDTHPFVERMTRFISTEYVTKGHLAEQIAKIISEN